jgi:hypothetical protein
VVYTVTVGSLIAAAFFIGRHTATLPAPSAPPADPCDAIVASVNKLAKPTPSPGSGEYVFQARTIAHLVVDHSDCFSPELVAQYKALLDVAGQ